MTELIRLEPAIVNPRLQIRCGGDLLVEGWEQPLIEVDGQGIQPVVEAGPEQVEIETESSCTVRQPRTTELTKITAEGQVKVSNLHGGLELVEARGDLHVDGVGSVKIGSAAGRVTVANVAGDVQVKKRAQGDLHVDGVGSVKIGSAAGRVTVANVAGDVQVKKRAQGDLSAQEIGGKIAVAEVAGRLTLRDVSAVQVKRAQSDVEVQNACGNIVVGRADGTVRLESVEGAVALEKGLGAVFLRCVRDKVGCDQVNGQLHVADTGEVAIRQVKGDLTAEEIHGALACQEANGRTTLRAVGGSISLGGVGGGLAVEGCGGSLTANCGGSAALSKIRGNVLVHAGGEIRCRFDENAGGSVKAVCGGSLTVVGSPTPVARGPGVHHFRVGALKNSYNLVAGSGVHVESDASLAGLGDEEGARGAQFAARAQRRAVRSLGRTLRRNIRAAGKRAAAGNWDDARSWKFRFDTDSPAAGAAVRDKATQSGFADIDIDVDLNLDLDVDSDSESDSEPVSEEERLTVLRMLAEGKITAAEAEQLLEALGSGE